MTAPTYGNITAPTVTRGFFIQPESRVVWNGTLETTSYFYTTYLAATGGIHLGFTAGTGTSLGQLATAPRFQQNPNMTKIDAGNMLGTLYEITTEETTITVTIRQFNPTILKEAFATGNIYSYGNEKVITWGQGCTLTTAPLVIEFSNVDCGVPTSPNIATGITGGILTLYSTYLTNGINWELAYGAANQLELVFTAQPDTTNTIGNRIGSLYIY